MIDFIEGECDLEDDNTAVYMYLKAYINYYTVLNY